MRALLFLKKNFFEVVLIFLCLLFSWWLMYKSFDYDSQTHRFIIARHQVGDFGLHLSLIRSISLGDNFPIESPFYPGRPMPYHYLFDVLVGLIERTGLNITLAFNGLSILFFTSLLYLLYKIPQIIFEKNKLLSVLSVLLFLFHSSFSFLDFFKMYYASPNTLVYLWNMPDYLHKGPFDGSIISLFFTLNVFLNQRHFIMGLVIHLFVFYVLFKNLKEFKDIKLHYLILLGILFGLSSRVHSLSFFSFSVIFFGLFLMYKKVKQGLYFFIPLILIFSFHLRELLALDATHPWFHFGYLAKQQNIASFTEFWVLNLGIAFFLIPISLLFLSTLQRKLFVCFFILFFIGNIIQFSYRIDHNHSLFNIFIIFANFYIAYFLISLLRKNFAVRILGMTLLFFLTVSGLIDMMAIKNDFHLSVPDAPSNTFMQWIKIQTSKDAIFLSRREILDPVTLSGRKNYFGHDYYLSVMGYDITRRGTLVKQFFEANDRKIIEQMRSEHISYIVIPNTPVSDFSYIINTEFLKKSLQIVYQDKNVTVFKV